MFAQELKSNHLIAPYIEVPQRSKEPEWLRSALRNGTVDAVGGVEFVVVPGKQQIEAIAACIESLLGLRVLALGAHQYAADREPSVLTADSLKVLLDSREWEGLVIGNVQLSQNAIALIGQEKSLRFVYVWNVFIDIDKLVDALLLLDKLEAAEILPEHPGAINSGEQIERLIRRFPRLNEKSKGQHNPKESRSVKGVRTLSERESSRLWKKQRPWTTRGGRLSFPFSTAPRPRAAR